MGSEMVSTIIEALTAFVSGCGGAFLSAFQNLFMIKTTDGTFSGLNDLGLVVLIFFGISLGYGVIRWITGLFRREAN